MKDRQWTVLLSNSALRGRRVQDGRTNVPTSVCLSAEETTERSRCAEKSRSAYSAPEAKRNPPGGIDCCIPAAVALGRFGRGI